MLRQAGKLLINIHGQNDSQALLDADSHIRYLDAYIGAEELLHDYGTVYRDLREAESALAALQQNEAEKLRLREMLLYQIRDIDAVKPKEGEEEKLENECSRLQNLEKIQKQVSFCERVLDERGKRQCHHACRTGGRCNGTTIGNDSDLRAACRAVAQLRI